MKTFLTLGRWAYALGAFAALLIGIRIRLNFASAKAINPWIKKRIAKIFNGIGSRIQIEFSTPLSAEKAYVFMANHTSLIDIPLLQLTVPDHFIGILASPQFRYFLYGKTIIRMGHLAIHRDNVRSSLTTFERAKEILASGTHIVVLPEGGRSMTGQMIPFKKLPFRFAIDANATIVPMGISGAYHMKQKSSWHLNPGKLVVRFGKPIETRKMSTSDAGTLKDEVYQSILNLLEPFEAGTA